MLSVVSFIVAISVLVAAHELGHFWVARRLGFKVLRFSIGFGKPLLVWRSRHPDRTEYWLSMIPLGGYVKMLDERETPVPEADRARAFNHRPIPHRIAVLLAGPAFNFLFAIVAYWLMFSTGVPGLKAVIGAVQPDSVAARAGIVAGDEIVAVGGRPTATWENATLRIFDELLADARIDLTLREPGGSTRNVQLDVRGREAELTEPSALYTGLGVLPGPVLPAVIDAVTPDSPAAAAGLEGGDEVIAVGDKPVRSWDQWVSYIKQRPGESVDVTVRRGGHERTFTVAIGTVQEGGKTVGRIGASRATTLPPGLLDSLRAEQRYGVLESLPRGVEKTWEMSALTVRMLVRMVVGDVSLKNMSGPLTIADYAGESAQAGLAPFLSFLAAVSISLGILNLLPIPMLDGGQVVYQIAEWFKGSPLSERALVLGQQIGVFFLIVLMSFAFYNDLSRIFGS
ncbi:MAG TPA: RIP metalloprotease RseP [Gammaproteobacteria bacterium]|nr:RIP metalloprotease RseP [Gammaproteobacteria bacterium]